MTIYPSVVPAMVVIPVVHLAVNVLLVPQVRLAPLGLRVPLVRRDRLAPPGRKVLLVPRVRQAPLERRAPLVPRVRQALPGRRALPDLKNRLFMHNFCDSVTIRLLGSPA